MYVCVCARVCVCVCWCLCVCASVCVRACVRAWLFVRADILVSVQTATCANVFVFVWTLVRVLKNCICVETILISNMYYYQ